MFSRVSAMSSTIKTRIFSWTDIPSPSVDADWITPGQTKNWQAQQTLAQATTAMQVPLEQALAPGTAG
jgi:hypothetical protein